MGTGPQSLGLQHSSAKDIFGCQLGKLGEDRQIAGRHITFHRKAGDPLMLEQVSTPASDRGFLVGLSLTGAHRRRIFHEHHSVLHHFEDNTVYVRDFSESYKADLSGSFGFILMEISMADLAEIADGAEAGAICGLAPAVREPDPVLGGLARALFSNQGAPADINHLLVDQISAAIGAHLIHRYADRRPRSVLRPLQLSRGEASRAKEFLVSIDDVSIDNAARACGVSRMAFIRAFKQTTGQTPYEWLIEKRVDQARMLLRDSRLSLAAVSLACGFSDTSHFARFFTKATGITPAEWRRVRFS